MAKFRKVPWLTLGSRVYLEEYIKDKKLKMLEFGCGGSTIWFDSRVEELITIEHNGHWVNKVKPYINNAKIILENRPYHTVCERFEDNYFDIIIVDGRDRVKCAEASLPKLKKNGIFILDNSEREEYLPIFELTKKMKKTDFVEENKEWTTTIWSNND